MSRPGGIAWFARHEARLAWRDWYTLMTGGERRRIRTVVLGFLAFALFLHGVAALMIRDAGDLAGAPDRRTLLSITITLLLSWSLMLSQAMESVTRAFYARGDLDLILTSPAAAWRLFAVRIAAMAVTIMAMSLVLGAPFIDMLVWYDGPRWLSAYPVALALAMDAVALAVLVTVALFRLIGPKRTRAMSQVLAAVIGAGFVIGLQLGAIVSTGSMARNRAWQSDALLAFAPGPGSLLWWPARATEGDPPALAALFAASLAALAAATGIFAPRFGRLALATVGVAQGPAPRSRRVTRFHDRTPLAALRRKEWMLLLRDPWLMSQTLMQLLYLLPAAFLLWRNFYAGGASALLVPILIVAGGQLGGGLAWLAVSGEDAPELIATAPIASGRVLRAKAEAVLGGIAVIFAPFVVGLAVAEPFAALITLGGVAVAAGSATAIQYWFRTQARRSLFRKRQTSSRVATFAEALSSIGWAGTGAFAATGTWLAVIPGILVLALVAGVWLISPSRNGAAG